MSCECLKELSGAGDPDAYGGVFAGSGKLAFILKEDHFIDGFLMGGGNHSTAGHLHEIKVGVVLRYHAPMLQKVVLT